MKKIVILVCITASLMACGSGIEKKANEKLAAAEAAFAQGDYNEAKQQIDSIKILYPKAFKARRAGQELMLDVELKAQLQRVDSLDNALQEAHDRQTAIIAPFTLEKDTAYQQIGNYLWSTQTIERNLHRSYLRFQVNEQGIMSMTSIYCGTGNIHHTGVKVIAPDGTYAETPPSRDSYETTDLEEKIEKADYRLGDDGGVIEFVVYHKNDRLRVEYMGGKKYITTLLPTDLDAAVGVYELTQILSSIRQMEEERKEAELKIEFIRQRKERNAALKEEQ